MTNHPLDTYLGYYQIDKLVIQVKQVGQGLAVAFPGVPEGYEVPLEITQEPDTFIMRGGPFSGAPVAFDVSGSGTAAAAARVGRFNLEFRDPPAKDESGLTTYMAAPRMVLDQDKVADFGSLWTETKSRPNGAVID